MESKGDSDSKEDSKLIRCKNCRQDILASKMFLHEGFCHRNNIYCEHCGKVLLKKDYESHFIINSNKKERKTQKIKGKKQKEIQRFNFYRSPIITKRNTAFEFVEMPMTEEYKINNPIIISEDGKILSMKNKNEYLLPYFGIHNTQNNYNNDNNQINKELFGNDFISNQIDLFKDDNTNNNLNNIFKEIDFVNDMKYSASMTNLLPNNNIYEEYLLFKYNKEQLKQENNKYLNEQINNNINNDLKYKNKNNSSLLNNISFTEENIIQENINNIDNENDINNNENKQNNNNIIINNNIITYNSNDNINKINNIFDKYKDNQLFDDNNNINTKLNNNKDIIINVPKNKRSTSFNPLRITNKEEMKKFNIKLKKNIKHNDLNFNSKEPNDSNTKQIITNKIITSYILEKKPRNNKNNKIRKKLHSIENKLFKKDTKIKKCEFCNSNVEDLIVHYQYYHSKKNNQIFVPKKRDTALLNEKLNCTNIEEGGLDEKNKKILLREFKPSLHNKTTLDNLNNNLNNINSDIKSEKKFFSKPNKIEKMTFNRILSTKNVKNSPEDSKRKNNIPKTQERDFEHKKFIELNNEYLITSEDKSVSKKYNGLNYIGSPQITTSHYNYSNNIFSPIVFYQGKRNNYFIEEIFNSPNNSYINNNEFGRNSFENNDFFNI